MDDRESWALLALAALCGAFAMALAVWGRR